MIVTSEGGSARYQFKDENPLNLEPKEFFTSKNKPCHLWNGDTQGHKKALFTIRHAHTWSEPVLGIREFWYGSGSGSSDPYLWLTDPDADQGGPKPYGSYGSGSPTPIRTYISRLAGPDPHSFIFPDPDTLLFEFWLKRSGSTFIFVERVHLIFSSVWNGLIKLNTFCTMWFDLRECWVRIWTKECWSATPTIVFQGSGSSSQNKQKVEAITMTIIKVGGGTGGGGVKTKKRNK